MVTYSIKGAGFQMLMTPFASPPAIIPKGWA